MHGYTFANLFVSSNYWIWGGCSLVSSVLAYYIQGHSSNPRSDILNSGADIWMCVIAVIALYCKYSSDIHKMHYSIN